MAVQLAIHYKESKKKSSTSGHNSVSSPDRKKKNSIKGKDFSN